MNQLITLDPNAIKQLDGLYCLNDLHRLAGGKPKHSPYEFLRSEVGKGLLDELEREFKGSKIPEPYIKRVVGKGKPQGTYVCRELVYAYANWISPALYLAVIRVFDRIVSGQGKPLTLADKFHQKTADLRAITDYLHECGSGLAIHGKQTKPQLLRELKELQDQIQPQLPFLGGEQ